MMGAILAYFGSKMYLLLIGADLNAQFKIVYRDGTKVGDHAEANASDLRSASENDVNNDLKVRLVLRTIVTHILHSSFFILHSSFLP